MNSRLSLRIPSIEDLSRSPSPLQLGSFNEKLPFSGQMRRNSRGESLKFKSGLERISSDRKILHNSLPDFLRVSSQKSVKNLRNLQANEKATKRNSECFTDTSSIPDRPLEKCIAINRNTENFSDFIERIQNTNALSTEILITTGQISLRREDLQGLLDGNNLSHSVIDACLLLIKHKNKEQFKNKESHDRVAIFSTAFAQNQLTDSKPRLMCKRNPLKYE